ncbi:hypothetical protein CRYUN_Cryun32bG0054200 [Craigia yunnanensis]
MARGRKPSSLSLVLGLVVAFLWKDRYAGAENDEYLSAVGDPGMRRDGLRLAIEAWNQCNEVGEEVPHMGSPRAADCFDIYKASQLEEKNCSLCNLLPYVLVHRVTEDDNKLGVGDPFLGVQPNALVDVNLYAANKELYPGSKCQVQDTPNPWHIWMIMLKSGNMDTFAVKCPKNGHKTGPFGPDSGFPCFGKGCMNQPLIYHDYMTLGGPRNWYGKLYILSYLEDSTKYPWLMLYLRSDATYGLSGGYHYPARGLSKIIPESPNFKVRFTLDVIKGGGPSSQFYLIDIGSCWKHNGQQCDGDTTSDVTRYCEMIINPNITAWCNANSLNMCPPYHTIPNGTRNAEQLEVPHSLCDLYINPQPQEILQILTHPVWGENGYPTKQGEGWIDDPRTWELDVGRLSQSLYFNQDPGTPPARRKWMSVDLRTEIFKDPDQVASLYLTNDCGATAVRRD